MSIVIDSAFETVKLNDNSAYADGRKMFFSYIMSKLQEVDDVGLACFIIGRKLAGAGGYFTGADEVNRIVLPEGSATYDPKTKELTFKDDDEFTIFIHEASHFMHLVVDKGEFISPSFKHLKPMEHAASNGHLKSNTKYLEYEAGYRSLYFNEIYEMFEDNSQILRMNLMNMMHYMKVKSSDEFIEEYKKLTDEAAKKEFLQKRKGEIDEKLKSITKWSQIDSFELDLTK